MFDDDKRSTLELEKDLVEMLAEAYSPAQPVAVSVPVGNESGATVATQVSEQAELSQPPSGSIAIDALYGDEFEELVRQSEPTVRVERRQIKFGDSRQLLQDWRGTVTEIGELEFTATLSDQTNPGCPMEVATFEIADVVSDDRALLRPGAVFYWSIGRRITASGNVEMSSVLRFQRLPGWTATQVEQIRGRARALAAKLRGTNLGRETEETG